MCVSQCVCALAYVCVCACVCVHGGQDYSGSVQEACGRNHSTEDPQFGGSGSFTDYIQMVNHEIDIEVRAPGAFTSFSVYVCTRCVCAWHCMCARASCAQGTFEIVLCAHVRAFVLCCMCVCVHCTACVCLHPVQNVCVRVFCMHMSVHLSCAACACVHYLACVYPVHHVHVGLCVLVCIALHVCVLCCAVCVAPDPSQLYEHPKCLQ